ncbi:MAG: FtsX-like permease family protein, partial [Acidobacteriota bacterium]
MAPLAAVISGEVRPILLLLLGGAGLLLLIACVDVASLLLVRSEHRRHELAMRRALGASRGRLIRQFAAEALVLSLAGTPLALAAAGLLVGLLAGLLPPDVGAMLPALTGLTLNAHMAAAGVVLGVGAAALQTAAPLLRLPRTAREGLTEGSRGAVHSGWRRFGFKLVAAELAMATVLLAGGGLLGRSLQRLLAAELGFNPAPLVALRIYAPPSRYASDPPKVALAHEILERVGQLPGVEAAGLTSVLPVSCNGNTDWIRFVGRPFGGEHNEVNMRDVSAGYFAAIGATIVRGRAFTAADNGAGRRVAIVNRALARRYFGDQDPVGTAIGDTALHPESIKTIVGVVDDVREGPLDAAV